MFSQFYLNTGLIDNHNSEVTRASRDRNNTNARTEYVLRYFDSTWYAPFGSEEDTQRICDEELQSNPKHNFYNYARAQLEKDPVKKRNYLMTAAKSTSPYNLSISAQAAYETAVSFYPAKGDKFTQCLAWFCKAIILGSPEAQKNFTDDNLCEKNKTFCISLMSTVFLTTHLSGKKIKGLFTSELLKKFPGKRDLLTQAYHYPNHPTILLEADSPTRKIAEWLVMYQKANFLTYFVYCYESEIISGETLQNLIQFYFSSVYTNKDDLRQKGIDILTQHNLLHLLQSQSPQVSSGHWIQVNPLSAPYVTQQFATYPIAPVINNAQSSYQYFYTQAPQMMPAQLSHEATLIPVYYTSVPTTSANSPDSYVMPESQESQITPQYFSFRS